MVAVQNAKSLTQANETGTVTVFNSQASTLTIAASALVLPQDWNSNLNVFLTLSGNTAGQSTVSGTNIVLAGGNNITLSAATAASAATISFNNPVKSDVRENQKFVGTSWSALGQNTLYLAPIFPKNQANVSLAQIAISFGGTSTTTATTRSWSVNYSACLYQIDVGANSTQLTSQSSVSGSVAIVRTSSSATYTTALNGQSGTTTASAFLTNAYILRLPMVTTLQAGQTYYLGLAMSTGSGGQNSAGTAAFMMLTDINSNWGQIASNGVTASNASLFFDYDGVIYTSTSGAWPGTIPFSSLSRAPSGAILYLEMVNQ